MEGMHYVGNSPATTSLLEDNSQPRGKEVAPNKAFGREVSKADPVPEMSLRLVSIGFKNKNQNTISWHNLDVKKLPRFIKRYLGRRYLKKRDNYLKNCIRAQGVLNQFIHISSQAERKAHLRQEWTNWAAHQFQGKGYAPSVAKFMAERALTQCDSDYGSVADKVNDTPMNPHSAIREIQEKKFQWAMEDFTVKGYDLEASREAIANALNTAGSNIDGFKHWVNQKVSPITGKASQLRPRMIQQIERKGFSTEEAQAVTDNLIKKSGGNEDLLRQSVEKMRPKGVPSTLSASQMHQKNDFSLKVLGVTQASSLKEVTRAYKILAQRYNPDRNPDNLEESTRIFQLITEAHRHLTQDSDLFKNKR
ncbi:J domain-containing protein [Endozoicomonas sp. ONNA2]|uniref:J domain-containing protein n=1 Tax=Endozoicomonas sp. ONNA2 TaxID=2828741 RepID=UPI0021473467|nr:J domain-containing protein [Endozoicomonas sp. ONNA2]